MYEERVEERNEERRRQLASFSAAVAISTWKREGSKKEERGKGEESKTGRRANSRRATGLPIIFHRKTARRD